MINCRKKFFRKAFPGSHLQRVEKNGKMVAIFGTYSSHVQETQITVRTWINSCKTGVALGKQKNETRKYDGKV
jgi:hypothetical protein